MQNENKPVIEVESKVEQKASNTRALIIVGVFVVLFICLIVFEISSKK